MLKIILVGAGGATGAVLRYLVSLIPLGNRGFPYKTLGVNLVGAVVIGVIAGLTSKYDNFNKNLELLIKVGLCGGFTTFSAFSLETLGLVEGGHIWMGIVYAVVSVILCFAGVFAGKAAVGLF